MRYLLTGGKGFLGSYIADHLASSGQEVTIATRNPTGDHQIIADFERDILEIPNKTEGFDFVVHAAGKAHIVPKTEEEKKAFFKVNVDGTLLLLSQLEKLPQLPLGIVFISSVGVYGRNEGKEIEETEPLASMEPYGLSKIQAEQILLDWGLKNKVPIGIARLPLIVGKNAPGNLGSMLKGIKTGRYFRLGKGDARKSMVWAGDVAAIIPKLAEKGGTYNLTDGVHPCFADLEDAITDSLKLKHVKTMPMALAWLAGLAGTTIQKVIDKRMPISLDMVNKITQSLTFSDKKARKELGWNPTPVLTHIKDIVV